MVTLSFSISPKNGSVKLAAFASGMDTRIMAGMNTAGALLERDMKKKLSGPGRFKGSTAGPISRLGNFPGVVTGKLRQSVGFNVSRQSGGPLLAVGPKAKYAPFLELGTRFMPGGYPFVMPTWEDTGEKAINEIQKEVMRPL